MVRLANKLKRVKDRLKHWSRLEFGKLDQKINSLENKIFYLENKVLVDVISSTESELFDTTQQLNLWMMREETYWRERSKVKWLKEGHVNTNFFFMPLLI